MNLSELYQQKHQLWLEILFASFAIDDEGIKTKLYDFSQMAFRHMKWIAKEILANSDNYNYDRDMKLYKRESLFEILEALSNNVKTLMQSYPSSALGQRMGSDDTYLLEYISQILQDASNDAKITAFNMARVWEGLDQEQVDALTLFLFAESYKEYELILIYSYMQARTDDRKYFDIYQDLVDESYFHLKSFGNMMAKLGILALPRELHERSYIIEDLDRFIVDGIAEEEAAKEMCKELSESITDEKLSKFFDFINYQENYHMELMRELLE